MFYKIHTKQAPSYLTTLLPPLSSRSKYTFKKRSYRFPTVSRTSTLNSLLRRAVALWNALPTNVQQASSIYAFKKLLQSHLKISAIHNPCLFSFLFFFFFLSKYSSTPVTMFVSLQNVSRGYSSGFISYKKRWKTVTIALLFLIFFFCFFFLSLSSLLVMSHTSHLQERSPTSIGLLFLQSCLNMWQHGKTKGGGKVRFISREE